MLQFAVVRVRRVDEFRGLLPFVPPLPCNLIKSVSTLICAFAVAVDFSFAKGLGVAAITAERNSDVGSADRT
jgi:hypothetical protein